jgi:hypothetical protein
MSEREQVASGGEPLFTETRRVQDYGGSATLYQSIPETAVELLDLDSDCELEIDIYADGYVVRKK